jgi:DNA-binding SARP family transcriptional activator
MDRGRSGDAGAQLRGYRRKAGLTQRQLADAAGVSIGVVRDLEQRRTAGLQPESVRRLASALRLSRLQAAELAQAAQKVSAAEPGRLQALSLGVLGPLRAWRGVEVPIGGPMQRAVLGLLALYPESGLHRTALIDALWGDDPPATAVSMIQVYVRRLRHLLGGGGPDTILVATAGRYRLNAAACDLDQVAFATLASCARDSHASGDLTAACEAYARALELWRGEPLSDVDALRDHPAITRLNQQRAEAVTGYAEAAAAAGWHDRVLMPLQELTGREPLHERAHARLMIALAGSGQQAAALRLYEALRRRLDEQLGILPGTELADAHARILRQDVHRSSSGNAASVPAAAEPAERPLEATRPAVPRQLPAPVTHFAGRAGELAALVGLPGRAGAELPEAVVISAIDGMPGVGKTALALQAGHLLADRFPDRQIFVDLHGHASGHRPADPADVLAGLLAADGVDPRYLPADLDGRAAMWRDRLAGQRVLLILDNAASSAQVAPLLPGTAGCLVLVTSRRYLGDLPEAIMEMPLDVLRPADASAMFTGLAPRSASDPDPVGELVALCGYLPLAIALLATLFTRHRSWTMSDLITETRTRLLTVTAESRTVAAAFELSYQALDHGQRQFFRHLGLHPGADVDPYAAAALTGLPLGLATGYLDALHGSRLLEEPAARRFRMHDLIRQYARGLAEAEDAGLREQAVDRLLEYYQVAARAAGSHVARHALPAIAPSGPPVTMPDLSGWDAARAWMTAERPNLVACIEDAAVRHDPARQVGLTAAVAAHLRIDGPWPQGTSLHSAAAAAASQSGDQLGQAGALVSLGDLRRLAGDYRGAIGALEQARGIYADIGSLLGEANALLCLGEVRRSTGDFPAAASLLEQARDIYADTGGLLGEAGALLVLGTVWQVTGGYSAAVDALERSLEIYRRAASRLGEAEVLRNLGAVRNLTGDHPAAHRALQQALGISAALGDRFGEANALACLGLVRQGTGDLAGAVSVLERALATFRDIGSRLGEANALCWLGDVLRETGKLPEAAHVLNQALAVYREIGNRPGTASALHNLGSVHQTSGDVPAAEDLLAHARDLYQDVGDALGEAQTLNQIGTLRLESGQPRSARPNYRRALEISRSIDNQLEEDRALEGILKCDTAMAVGPAPRSHLSPPLPRPRRSWQETEASSFASADLHMPKRRLDRPPEPDLTTGQRSLPASTVRNVTRSAQPTSARANSHTPRRGVAPFILLLDVRGGGLDDC